ncbi:alpha/beta hydrolase [Asticcacaulis sp. BYS171W]|uniref:Alpha/beta hydrolase n=1 Tax=Asticcacaulis aquaticus TaxID=2984212 RepID=A0ABT5HYQ0_9CAUL|nr:alpha/beta hydrolase [Asticcacaulis aquaticus]MDC7685202.1 alpha/beta hydrolase [Asticcacaulis aquaticus]
MRLLPLCLALIMTATVPVATLAQDGPLRERLKGRMADRLQKKAVEEARPVDLQAIAAGAQKQTLSYGTNSLQAIDVYTPANAKNAPMIVMVHGGAWKIGDKANTGSIENKLKHWLPKGYIVISVNYRLLPTADAYAQADDIATALAFIQNNAAKWGGDVDRLILMGHSAGAQLVAVTSADPSVVTAKGGRLWAGTVVLDSATMDLQATMGQKRLPAFYTEAFGSDPGKWAKASPLARLTPQAVPMMIVCSTQRPDKPCDQADTLSAKLKSLGKPAPVQKEALSHADINRLVGTPGDYTAAIDAFIAARIGK